MKIERYIERMNEIEQQMENMKRYSPEWERLDTEREKTAVKIADIKRRQKHEDQFLKTEKRKSIIHRMKDFERYSPEWSALSEQLLNMV